MCAKYDQKTSHSNIYSKATSHVCQRQNQIRYIKLNFRSYFNVQGIAQGHFNM